MDDPRDEWRCDEPEHDWQPNGGEVLGFPTYVDRLNPNSPVTRIAVPVSVWGSLYGGNR